MLGKWQDWQSCEARCDIGRRSRNRAFEHGDNRHYTTDLEHQVFALVAGQESLEKQRDSMLLNITALKREIDRLKDGDALMQKRLDEGSWPETDYRPT